MARTNPFPKDIDQFDNDDRVSFDKQENKYLLVDENAEVKTDSTPSTAAQTTDIYPGVGVQCCDRKVVPTRKFLPAAHATAGRLVLEAPDRLTLTLTTAHSSLNTRNLLQTQATDEQFAQFQQAYGGAYENDENATAPTAADKKRKKAPTSDDVSAPFQFL